MVARGCLVQFSRHPVPGDRDGVAGDPGSSTGCAAKRLYSYNVAAYRAASRRVLTLDPGSPSAPLQSSGKGGGAWLDCRSGSSGHCRVPWINGTPRSGSACCTFTDRQAAASRRLLAGSSGRMPPTQHARRSGTDLGKGEADSLLNAPRPDMPPAPGDRPAAWPPGPGSGCGRSPGRRRGPPPLKPPWRTARPAASSPAPPSGGG
jgi:hypothetical protein